MKQEKVIKEVINGTEYEIRKLKMGLMVQILPEMADPDKQNAASVRMVGESVTLDGVQLREIMDDVDFADYVELSKIVVEFNGLGNES